MSIDNLYLKKYVDNIFEVNNGVINTELVANEFLNKLIDFSDEDFLYLLINTGFIPDFYKHDSSEEVLFTKLVECTLAEWARRMGFDSEILKEKSSKEDVKITIDNKVIVADAKSFRLGRSQKAPNAKDFLKLEDIRKWKREYDNAIGGLVTYPSRHEWKVSSDIYTYCSDKSMPTVMLPYTYLAYFIKYKNNFNVYTLLDLWNYEKLFKTSLPKNMKGGNKRAYWKIINDEILYITGTTSQQLKDFLNKAENIIDENILSTFEILEKEIENKEQEVKAIIDNTDDEIIRENYTKFRVKAETSEYRRILSNIRKFRL